jgi:hypothetical protein
MLREQVDLGHGLRQPSKTIAHLMGTTSTLGPAKTRQARQQYEYAHGALLLLPALLLQLPAVHTVCVFDNMHRLRCNSRAKSSRAMQQQQ